MLVRSRRLSRAEIKAYVKERTGKGLASAGAFAVSQLKAVVGVQAPRKRSKTAVCGYIATTRATPGAPPRRVSGCGQASIYWRRTQKGGLAFGARRDYMMILEYRKTNRHPWLRFTVKKLFKDILTIAGKYHGRGAK